MIERHALKPGELHPLRDKVLTASVVPALFGVHQNRSLTPRALYAKFAEGIELPNVDNVSAEIGRRLERVAGDMFAERHPEFYVREAREFVVDPALRLGATPDRYITEKNGPRRGVGEIKTTTAYYAERRWEFAPPLNVLLQTTVQGFLTEADFLTVILLIHDSYAFELREYSFEPHAAAVVRIVDRVGDFWQSVDTHTPPKFDFEHDGDLIAAMFPRPVEEKVIDLRHDNMLPGLLAERARLMTLIREAEALREPIDNEIKAKIGDAEVALAQGWRLTFKEQTRQPAKQASRFRVLRATRDKDQ